MNQFDKVRFHSHQVGSFEPTAEWLWTPCQVPIPRVQAILVQWRLILKTPYHVILMILVWSHGNFYVHFLSWLWLVLVGYLFQFSQVASLPTAKKPGIQMPIRSGGRWRVRSWQPATGRIRSGEHVAATGDSLKNMGPWPYSWSLQVSLVTSVCGLWLLFPAIEHTVLVWTNYIILSLFTHSSLHMAMDEVNATSWPDGPSNLNDLFLWPHYNCCCLLNHPDVGDQCTANALAVMDYDIYINDCYSGTGCGSISLWLQHDELKRTKSQFRPDVIDELFIHWVTNDTSVQPSILHRIWIGRCILTKVFWRKRAWTLETERWLSTHQVTPTRTAERSWHRWTRLLHKTFFFWTLDSGLDLNWLERTL